MHDFCVDIIIPVYNAADHVERCIDSVLCNTFSEFNLIVIDDASPEAATRQLMGKLKDVDDQRITVLTNPENSGFVGTVNKGMTISTRDVVLLNSDTIVTKNWLKQLKQCAVSDQTIGTITPFSNNAEICSFPNFCQDNPVPDNPERIAQSLAAAEQAVYPEIPTAVGFCMYITRSLLDDVGNFNEQAFGRGYGEENDFCRRAVQAGYRNVLCDTAYVVHVGSRSFGAEKQAHCERNMQVLLSLHPDYLDIVSAFIENDPIKPIREAAIQRLQEQHQASNSSQPDTWLGQLLSNAISFVRR